MTDVEPKPPANEPERGPAPIEEPAPELARAPVTTPPVAPTDEPAPETPHAVSAAIEAPNAVDVDPIAAEVAAPEAALAPVPASPPLAAPEPEALHPVVAPVETVNPVPVAAVAAAEPERATGDGGVGLDAGRDVAIGRDVAGRDIVNTSQTGVGTQTIGTVSVGWGEQAVIRLALVVGALVFVTAACFFSGGLAVGGIVFGAFSDRALTPSPEQADAFQQQLDGLDSVQSGETFTLVLNEAELNAFVHYRLGPQIGFALDTGEARLINDGGQNVIAVRGDYAPLGGMPVIATFSLTNEPGAPLQLTGASARLFGSRDGGFGWVYLPASWLRAVEIQVNGLLGNVKLDQAVVAPNAPDGAPWEVTGEVR